MPSADRTAATPVPANRAVARIDAESADWIARLRTDGPSRSSAVNELHEMLLRIARAELNRRRARLHIGGPELDDLAYQAAADALLAIIAKLDQFRGESRFTTWAYKFVVFEVSAKIGRHFWRDGRVALDDADWDRLPDRFGLDPHRESEWHDLVAEIRRLVETDLSDRQRDVFVAIVVEGWPLDALVQARGTTRNAIYKTLFDARRKLRAALVANGYLDGTTAEQP